jgi:hypothetical protein
MSDLDPAGTDWTKAEIDLIVADYFEMLRLELTGQPYVKSHRNAALQQLTRRSRGSIEFKHQNISAVLLKLGMQWISGYKPMPNFQNALISGIERYLDLRRELFSPPAIPETIGLSDTASLYFGPPPPLEYAGAFPDSPALQRLVRKFDAAARDARNRALGKKGEERILSSERYRLRAAGRTDLARKVRWISEEEGDGAGFDIHSYSFVGEDRLIEVKTTTGPQMTPFYVSENERALSVERPEAFRLVRVYDFAKAPKAFKLKPPLENSVFLRAANYRASFQG